MARQKNHVQNTKDKAAAARQNEKIINDFLLQFAYTLTIGVISIFMSWLFFLFQLFYEIPGKHKAAKTKTNK